MAVKIHRRKIFRLVKFLNQSHGQMPHTIMIQLELLLCSGQIGVPNIVDGRDVAMATRFFSMDDIVMTFISQQQRQSRLFIDVGTDGFGLELGISG